MASQALNGVLVARAAAVGHLQAPLDHLQAPLVHLQVYRRPAPLLEPHLSWTLWSRQIPPPGRRVAVLATGR